MDDDEFGKDRVHINAIQSLVKGGGSACLETLCKNADDLQVTLSLNALPFHTERHPELMDRQKLIEWYGRFGFKRMNSNRSVFRHMAALMVRYPRR